MIPLDRFTRCGQPVNDGTVVCFSFRDPLTLAAIWASWTDEIKVQRSRRLGLAIPISGVRLLNLPYHLTINIWKLTQVNGR
jgi:hypothetical protein